MIGFGIGIGFGFNTGFGISNPQTTENIEKRKKKKHILKHVKHAI